MFRADLGPFSEAMIYCAAIMAAAWVVTTIIRVAASCCGR